MKKSKRERLQERILRNSVLDSSTGCRLWTARINNQGYPVMTVWSEERGKNVKMFAHRVSLEVFSRAPREGEEAAHAIRCPHKHCVAREHLRWATRSQNDLDKRRASRLRLREVHPPVHAVGCE